MDYLLKSYDYHLPEELIALRHIEPRDHSRLLVYDERCGEISHRHIYDLPTLLPQESTIVFNESRVFPCRLLCQKESQGKGGAELFFLEIMPNSNNEYRVLIRCRGTKKVGDRYILPGFESAEITKLLGDSFLIKTSIGASELSSYLEREAKIPIPPYIRNGESDSQDRLQYQTVYAGKNSEGSVAAPTAGLHFTEELLQQLDDHSINSAYVTLHVGMGTFSPVKSELITDHQMHSERFMVERSSYETIKNSKFITAVGTTSLRTLESMSRCERFAPDTFFDTDIFIYPGERVSSINALLTNFHLPKSSLLMLVSALIGREKCLELYEIAIKERYRFFSYGDAMLILRK